MASLSMPRVEKARGLKLMWNTVWARAYPRMIGAWREKSWTFFDVLLPTLGTIAFVFVYRALDAPKEFEGFVVVGGAMTAFWLNVLWSMGAQLYWDKDQGNLELYVVSPGPLMGVLLGMAVGGLVMAGVRAAIILIFCSIVFHVSYSLSSLPLLVLAFFMTMTALYGMGMLFASVFLVSGRDAWHLSNLFQEPIYLAAGNYFPVISLGVVAAYVASIVPMTLGLDAIRQLLFQVEPKYVFLQVWQEIAILTVMAVIFICAAWYALSKLEIVGRREGRLIERRK